MLVGLLSYLLITLDFTRHSLGLIDYISQPANNLHKLIASQEGRDTETRSFMS